MKDIIRKYCIAVFLCSLFSCKAHTQNDIDAYMNGLLKDKKIAGVSIAVAKNNKWVFKNNYGYADVQNGKAVTDSTTFNIMSVTKNFIAIAIVQLADKKKISLDDAITKYLPALPSYYNNVLIYQLLSHSAGVPDYVHVEGYMKQANRKQNPLEILQPIINKPLDFSPGEKCAYSNSGYFLLGLIIEKASGIKLGEYLKQNIFVPLKMDKTYFDEGAWNDIEKAKGYNAGNGGLELQTPLNPSQYWAAGAIVTTVNDMMKWDNALKNGKLLPAAEVQQMKHPVPLKSGGTADYGLGFELMNTPEMRVAGYNGVGLGFNASYMNFLNDSLTIIVLTNTTNGNSSLICKNIRDILAGGNGAKAPVKQEAHDKDSLDMAVEKVFANAGQEGTQQYFQDADAFNKFTGEQLKFIEEQGKFKDAVRMGEKVNPQTIIRRYQLNFEKGAVTWVIIFSKQGKVLVTNHM